MNGYGKVQYSVVTDADIRGRQMDELISRQAADVPVINVGDMISRQAAIDKFKPWLKVEGYSEGELNMLRAVIYELENLPPVQPKRGKWIPEYNTTKNGYYRTAHYCSCCKFYYTTSPEEMNFCPYCGAKMERGDSE